MLFNSIPFVIFLLTVLTLFNLLPPRRRLLWLLLSGYFFYGWWNPLFLPLLLGSTLLNFIISLWLNKATGHRKELLAAGIGLNLALLSYFKYRNFFLETVGFLPVTSLVLPLGLSFICLQAISYLIDVYRKKIAPPDFLSFALYKAFFPQLPAGPIERAGTLIPQFTFNSPTRFNWIVQGTKLIVWGYYKKVLVADKLALVIDPVFANPQLFNPILLLAATVLFSGQIYCDFSGYTDIARGAALTFGVNLSPNFCNPFGSSSLQIFWQRWHRTLHCWFKDYLYVPLEKVVPHKVRILLVFLLSGLWHGADLTFVAWGLFHGILYIITYEGRKILIQIPYALQVALTFTLVTLGWVFFRAQSLSQAVYIFTSFSHIHVLSLPQEVTEGLQQLYQHTMISPASLSIILSLLLLFLLIEYTGILKHLLQSPIDRTISIKRLILMDLLLILIVLFGDWAGNSFIYYQF